ncbi:hypothetical protein LCGC14_0390870 [marine sediment metagenome]|uniref:Uncharacterized protein n=1 Tax=marine sediment metagenome TaxID=412755 RepID=A0A0F9THS9_9ZZZZ
MAKKKKPRKKKNGRPSQYKARYCGMLIRFFDIEPFEEVRIPHYDESGKEHKSGRHKGETIVTHYEIQRNPNRTPTLQRFAKKIKVGISTIYRWLDENEETFKAEFRDAFTCARACRRSFLIENGLCGCHSPAYAKFVAVNLTDMKDTQKQEVTGPEGRPIPVSIIDYSTVDLDSIKPNGDKDEPA